MLFRLIRKFLFRIYWLYIVCPMFYWYLFPSGYKLPPPLGGLSVLFSNAMSGIVKLVPVCFIRSIPAPLGALSLRVWLSDFLANVYSKNCFTAFFLTPFFPIVAAPIVIVLGSRFLFLLRGSFVCDLNFCSLLGWEFIRRTASSISSTDNPP